MFWNPNGLKALWCSIRPRHFRFFRVSSKRSECSEQESKNRIIHQMPFNFDFLLDHSFAKCPENVTADVFENVTLGLWKEKKIEKENVVNNTSHYNMFVTTEIQSQPIFPLIQALEFGNFTLSFWQTWSKYCQVRARATYLNVRRTCTSIFRRKKVAKQARSKHKLGSFSINDGSGNDNAINKEFDWSSVEK